MRNIKHVIIPVDESRASKDAAQQGMHLAKLLDIDVKIITVNDTHQFISSTSLEEKILKETERFLEEFKKIGKELGIKVDTKLICGNPAQEIVKFAREDDLIIIANRGKKGIDRFLLGSVSQEVIRHAPCSILIVKSNPL